MITIVIPAYNELECTRACIASIVAHTEPPYKIILVDNGSDSPLAPEIGPMPGLEVIRSEENMGFAGGVNLGLARAEGHVVLLNNDTLVPAGWLERMRAVLLSAPDIGMVGPMSNYVSGTQLIPDLTFESLEEISDYAAARRAQYADKVRDVARIVGFCMLVREEAFAAVGLFDEAYGVGNFEDDDYCVRVLRAGYRLVVDEASFVFHHGHRTFRALGLVAGEWEKLLEQNAALFGAKWELKPEDRLDGYRQSIQLNRTAGETLEAGDVPGAVRGFCEAIRLAPHLARNHNDLGVALWRAGEQEKAFNRVKVALDLDPAYTEARENLADMGRALGREDEVRQYLAHRPEASS